MTYKEKAQEIAHKFSQEMIAAAVSNDRVPVAGILVSIIAVALEREGKIAQEKIDALTQENERLKATAELVTKAEAACAEMNAVHIAKTFKP